ncbi:MAG: gas vesicle protein [Chlorobi bacterium OLB4]|nr:MAG: gas vesicle protein [Chlorobi bacterium OLB4]
MQKKKASHLLSDANKILTEAKAKAGETYEKSKQIISNESDRVKDAFNAGLEAYNQEKKKID